MFGRFMSGHVGSSRRKSGQSGCFSFFPAIVVGALLDLSIRLRGRFPGCVISLTLYLRMLVFLGIISPLTPLPVYFLYILFQSPFSLSLIAVCVTSILGGAFCLNCGSWDLGDGRDGGSVNRRPGFSILVRFRGGRRGLFPGIQRLTVRLRFRRRQSVRDSPDALWRDSWAGDEGFTAFQEPFGVFVTEGRYASYDLRYGAEQLPNNQELQLIQITICDRSSLLPVHFLQ